MKIYDQICTPEQAKELVELGVKYDKPLYYFVAMSSPTIDEEIVLCRPASRFESDKVSWVVMGEASPELQLAMDEEKVKISGRDIYPAFNVAELGVMLPEDTRTYRVDGLWCAYYVGENDSMKMFVPAEETEARIRSSLLIKLIKQMIITVDQVNKWI